MLASLEVENKTITIIVLVVTGWSARMRQEKWGCECFSCWTLLRNLSSSSARTLIALFIFVTFIYFLVCAHTHRCYNTHVEVKRTAFTSLLSPSTMRVPGIELRSPDVAASSFIYPVSWLVGPRTLISIFRSVTLMSTETVAFSSPRDKCSKAELKHFPRLGRMKSDVCTSHQTMCCHARRC